MKQAIIDYNGPAPPSVGMKSETTIFVSEVWTYE